MNGFEKHGIKHLSASNLNTWIDAPDIWVLRYLLKRQTPSGAAAMRGSMVEKAVASTLLGMSQTEAISEVLDQYDQQFGDDQTQRDLIKPMVTMSIDLLKPYGPPDFPEHGVQHKISLPLTTDEFTIPVIGYLDFVFPQQGLVVDLKTTTRVPSRMNYGHKVQRVIYQKSLGNYAVKFLYVSGKKNSLLEDGDVFYTWQKITKTAQRIEKFLRLVTKEEAVEIIPHNPNTFYWKGLDGLREEVYG